jgi:hypothetical protein
MVRQSRATSKILILDCCYCGQAEALGPSDAEGIAANPAWLGDEANTCVLKAVGRNSAIQKADPYFEQDPDHPYTAFSGYLISVLENGIEGVRSPLQVRDVYNELRRTVPASGAHPEPELLIRNEPWIVLMENHHPGAEVGPPAEPSQLARLRAATPEELAEAWRRGESVTLSGLPRALIDEYFADVLPRADAAAVLRIVHHLHTTATGDLDGLLPLLHTAAPDNAGAVVRELRGHGCSQCKAFAGQIHRATVQALRGGFLHEYSKAASGG